MKIIKTKFKGLLIIKGTRHDDKRGYLREMILEKKIKQNLKFQIASVSKKNVILGLGRVSTDVLMHLCIRSPILVSRDRAISCDLRSGICDLRSRDLEIAQAVVLREVDGQREVLLSVRAEDDEDHHNCTTR